MPKTRIHDVDLTVITPKPIDATKDGPRFFRLLDAEPSLTPERFGHFEPLRTKYNAENQSRLLASAGIRGLLWKRSKPYSWGGVYEGGEPRSGSISLHASSIDCDGDALSRFAQSVTQEFRALFGYVHLWNTSDAEAMRGSGTMDVHPTFSPGDYSLMVRRWELVNYLPDLYWGTILGRWYTYFFGREKLASAPAPIVREVAADVFYIQLSDRFFDLIDRFEEVDAVRRKVKAHLNPRSFYNAVDGPDAAYEIPTFEDWEEPRRPKTGRVTEAGIAELLRPRPRPAPPPASMPPPPRAKSSNEVTVGVSFADLRRLLKRISKMLQAGIGDEEIRHISALVKKLKQDGVDKIEFTVQHNGQTAQLSVEMFRDDIGQVDMNFRSDPPVIDAVRSAIEGFYDWI